MENWIVINGEEGEGGGQVLRTSLTLSTITGKPFKLEKIRGKRKNPGLQKQHLACVQGSAEISQAKVEGDRLQSSTLTYEPQVIRSGNYSYDLKGAGSTMLVAQTIIPILIFAKEKSILTVVGGTHNDMAPPFDFVVKTLLPWTKRMGIDIHLELERYGFYPRGGGKIVATVHPMREEGKTLDLLDRGQLIHLQATVLVAKQPEELVKKEVKELSRQFDIPEESIHIKKLPDAYGPGNVLFVEALYEKGSQLFTSFCPQGKEPKQWVGDMYKEYVHIKETPALVEEYLCDQLLLYLALKQGGRFLTTEPLSLHSTTNMEIIEKFLPVQFKTTTQARGTLVEVVPIV